MSSFGNLQRLGAKCYFSHSPTSREHSKTQADVFKFKHATAVTARCEQHTAQTPLSRCLMIFVGEKKLERSYKLFGLRHSLGAALASGAGGFLALLVKCPLPGTITRWLKYSTISNKELKSLNSTRFTCWKKWNRAKRALMLEIPSSQFGLSSSPQCKTPNTKSNNKEKP